MRIAIEFSLSTWRRIEAENHDQTKIRLLKQNTVENDVQQKIAVFIRSLRRALIRIMMMLLSSFQKIFSYGGIEWGFSGISGILGIFETLVNPESLLVQKNLLVFV
jgi:hypothetical protein